MSGIEEKIPLVADLLKDAARRRSVVRWPVLFALCQDKKEETEAEGESFAGAVFDTLSKASFAACDHSIAVYASLIERPKKGFFSMHTIISRDYFKEIAGSLSEHDLVDDPEHREKADRIIAKERERVWTHAAQLHPPGG